VEYLGTYPLPEAQLDRFFMKVSIGYPEKFEESEILSRFHDETLGNLKTCGGQQRYTEYSKRG